MKSTQKNFFIWLSGADPIVLQDSSVSERRKHVKLGMVILVPAILAWGGMWFAAPYLGIEDFARIFISTIWSIIVLVIDTYLVSTLDKRLPSGKYRLIAVFRIVVSILLGIIISHPLILKVLEGNISEEIGNMKYEKLMAVETKYKDTAYFRNGHLRNELDSIGALIRRKEFLQKAEATGTKLSDPFEPISGKFGDGPLSKKIKSEIASLYLFRTLLTDSIHRNENDFRQLSDSEITLVKNKFSEDYLKRTTALSRLSDYGKDDHWYTIGPVTLLSKFLMLFFILLDSIAILAKVMTSSGIYERSLTIHEDSKFNLYNSVNSMANSEKEKMVAAIYNRSAYHPPEAIHSAVQSVLYPERTAKIVFAQNPERQKKGVIDQLIFLAGSTILGIFIWYVMNKYLPKEAGNDISITLSFYLFLVGSVASLNR